MINTSKLSIVRQTILSSLFAVLLVTLVDSPLASARPIAVSPQDCLNVWNNQSDRYYRENWESKEVTVIRQIPNPFGETPAVFTLRCGDELTGVIHIADDGSTGSVHPIVGEQAGQFVRCVEKTMYQGTFKFDSGSRTRGVYQKAIGLDEYSSVRVTNRGVIITAYTTNTRLYPQGNNWPGCANSD